MPEEMTLEDFYGEGELGKEKPKKSEVDTRRVPLDLTDIINEAQMRVDARKSERVPFEEEVEKTEPTEEEKVVLEELEPIAALEEKPENLLRALEDYFDWVVNGLDNMERLIKLSLDDPDIVDEHKSRLREIDELLKTAMIPYGDQIHMVLQEMLKLYE